MAKAKTKGIGTNLPVPQSDAEAEQQIAKLGALQRDLMTAQARHDASVAALETAHAEAKKVSEDDQKAIVEGLAVWASAHRERLTNGGKTKTVQLASGSILWREGRYSVKHRPLRVEEVIDAVRDRVSAVIEALAKAKSARRRDEVDRLEGERAALGSFLRFKVELNKEAMLADRIVAETVPGVTIPRGPEEFAVEPLASQIGEVA